MRWRSETRLQSRVSLADAATHDSTEGAFFDIYIQGSKKIQLPSLRSEES
jgi:hypothetical protein